MKKIICFLISVIMLFSFAVTASGLFDSGSVTSKLRSQIYYMENLDEGTVFFEKNSEKKTPAAAFVKVIASVVVLEKWGNLEGNVTVTKESLSLVDYDYGVRVALYKEGETVSKRELFDCIVVHGANDAASIAAYEISGSVEAFIAEMQALCTKIGCSSTVIKNITGFDAEGQYTTAGDVAKIIKYALNYPIFSEAFSAKTVTLKATDKNEERTYNSTNRMTNAAIADYYHSSVTGGKQTSTDEAGECIAVVSNKDGYSYLTVVMGGKLMDIDSDKVDENTCMTDARQMLAWVYDNIRYRVIVSPTQTAKTVGILAGKGVDTLRLVPEKETSALVPSKASPASVMFEIVEDTLPKRIMAPVKAGDVIAQAKVFYAERELTTINLVAAYDVELSLIGLIMTGIRAVVGSTAFLIISLILAVAASAIFVLNLLEYKKKQEQNSAKKEKNTKKPAVKMNAKRPMPQRKKTAAQPKTQPKGKGTLTSYQKNKNSKES